MAGPNSVTSTKIINQTTSGPQKSNSDSSYPSVESLKRFVGSQHVKHAASTAAWIGTGLTIAGIVLMATGIGAGAGAALIGVGLVTVTLAAIAYEVSAESSHPTRYETSSLIVLVDLFSFSYALPESGAGSGPSKGQAEVQAEKKQFIVMADDTYLKRSEANFSLLFDTHFNDDFGSFG